MSSNDLIRKTRNLFSVYNDQFTNNNKGVADTVFDEYIKAIGDLKNDHDSEAVAYLEELRAYYSEHTCHAEIIAILNDRLKRGFNSKNEKRLSIKELIGTLYQQSYEMNSGKFTRLIEVYAKSSDISSEELDEFMEEEKILSVLRQLSEYENEAVAPLVSAWIKEVFKKTNYSILLELALASMGESVIEPLTTELMRKCFLFVEGIKYEDTREDLMKYSCNKSKLETIQNSFIRIMELIGPKAVFPLINSMVEEKRYKNEAIVISLERITGANISRSYVPLSWQRWWNKNKNQYNNDQDIQKFTKNGYCFIATATMGDPNHPNVLMLQEFRDEYLMNSNAGRYFVQFYNRFSPYIAEIIIKHYYLRRLTYYLLIIPLTRIVKVFLQITNN